MHRLKVQPCDGAMSNVRQAKGQMQAISRNRDIVHIARGTCHVQARGVVGKRFRDAHGDTSRTFVAVPWSSSQ